MAKTTDENNKLTEAMQRADAAGASLTPTASELDRRLEAGVAEGVMAEAPIFNTHSTALAREMEAKAKAYVDQVAEIDAKIAALQAEREDYMLSYSMLSHAMQAREKGARHP